jgi:hypothetical protein
VAAFLGFGGKGSGKGDKKSTPSARGMAPSRDSSNMDGKKGRAAELMMLKMQGKTDKDASGAVNYQKIIDEKINAFAKKRMEEMQEKSDKYLNGAKVEGEGGMSAMAKQALEQIFAKRQKAMEKKHSRLEIKPTSFRGGKVDRRGNIISTEGRLIGKVDLKTGAIKSNMGFKSGVFKPDNMFQTIFELERMSDNFHRNQKIAPIGGWGNGQTMNSIPPRPEDNGGW